MAILPTVAQPSAFYQLLAQSEPWDAAIAAIGARHQLSGPFGKSRAGSTVVYLSTEWCIKLHPPLAEFAASHRREVTALRSIAGRLPIPTPEIVAEDTLDNWRYFVSTRLPGRAIDAVWDQLDAATRIRLGAQLGAAIRALHEAPAHSLAAITQPWDAFRTAQRAGCLDRERDKGLAPERLAELERYLNELDAIAEPRFTPALLHTEIGPSHVLVQGDQITGLIDFGDAMVGDPEYDLAPVGMFVTRGDAAAFGAFCRAYGLDDEQCAAPNRPARMLRHALLHRYGTLAWYCDVLGPLPNRLEEVAALWFTAT